MKALQLILILTILDFSFSQEVECSSQFEQKLQEKCQAIDSSCKLTELNTRCVPIKDCGSATDEASCSKIIPSNYLTHKCQFSSGACTAVPKQCTEWKNVIDGVQISGDTCSNLNPGTGDGIRCDISNTDEDSCIVHYSSCTNTNLNTPEKCLANIPSDLKKKCTYGTSCQDIGRHCEDNFYKMDSTLCSQLTSEVTGKKCIYKNNLCLTRFPTCEEYLADEVSCRDSNFALNSQFTDYDYSKKCYFDTNANTCKTRKPYCYEYDGDDANICTQLATSDDTNKKCLFDPDRTSYKCYEEYKSCQAYNDVMDTKSSSRSSCENIKLSDENKKCIYIRETDNCIETEIYTACDQYNGTDKFVCESIKSPTTNSYCVFDSDSICKEREFPCSEAYIKEDCLFYAKPVDSRKVCVFNDGTCHEVYAKCEDYIGTDEEECEDLELYNGKKCIYESNRCISKDKICSDATTHDECILIAKTGVSDPTKKVCDYLSYSVTEGGATHTYYHCIENYKYCSDYRGDNLSTCTNIKPYDETGSYVDETSECQMKDERGDDSDDDDLCQRVSKGCSVGNNNALLCAKLSPKIKENHKKHCVYDITTNLCNEQYKKCEDITGFTSSGRFLCINNKPKDYLNYRCEVETVDSVDKCVTKKSCLSFKEYDYAFLCESIHPNCTYSNGYCYNSEPICRNKKFDIVDVQNEEVCSQIGTDSPNTICTLKVDKSSCEVILKNVTISPPDATSNQNSSESLRKGIKLIMILISLLI